MSGDGATANGTTDVRTRRFNSSPVSQFGSGITHTNTAAAGTVFTINHTGTYTVWWYDRKSATGNYSGITINASDPTQGILTPIADTEVGSVDFTPVGAGAVYWTGNVKYGDILRPNDNQDSNGTVTPKFKIQRIG